VKRSPRAAGLILAALALAACSRGGAGKGRDPADTRGAAELARGIAELRLRLADSPRDSGLHLELARALRRAGQPGAAIRHFEEAGRRDALTGADARALAALQRERARARLALGDGGAWRDAEAAARLDPAAGQGALLRDSYFAGALAALRRADRPGRREAHRLLGVAEPLAPRDPRLAARDPQAADLADVGAAAAWLADGGAKRVALDTYRIYVDRGGRAGDHLRRYLALHRWWYGDRERPGAALLEELRAERFDLCGVARSPAELGCAEALVRAAENDPPAAEAIRRLAALRGWKTSDPAQAAAWAVAALRAWLDGRVGSWERELAARVDLAALTATEVRRASIALHARATLLRAAGQVDAARVAFDHAVEGAAALAPEARALLVAEAAAERRDDGVVDALLHAGPASDTAWRAALRGARDAEPGGAREVALCDAAPLALARDHLRRSGELGALAARFPAPEALHALARWHRVLASDRRLEAGRDALEARWRRLAAGAALPGRLPAALPVGVVDPHRIAGPGEGAARTANGLARVARAYLRDPALADRLAGEFVERAHAVGQRGPLLVELFARLGDPARASRWAERTSASSPDHASYLLVAGLAAAAAGDSARADVFFVRGAAASGDAGAASLVAARGFLAASRPLPALTAARRAFDLTAPGEPEHAAAVDAAARALDLLGRGRDAAGLRARLPAGALAEIAPPGAAPGLPEVDAPGWSSEVAALLALGLIAPPERAVPALAAVAEALDRAGLDRLAEAVRRERRSLLGPSMSADPGPDS
jgi:hypothetical protein